MGTVIFSTAKSAPIEDDNCMKIVMNIKNSPSYDFDDNVQIKTNGKIIEYVIPLVKKPPILNTLSLDSQYEFELSFIETGLYRLDKIMNILEDEEEIVEPDVRDTIDIATDLHLNIQRSLDEMKDKTDKLSKLREKVSSCKNDLKIINEVYEELNEYI